MDMSSATWFSEMGRMDYYNLEMNPLDFNSVDEFSKQELIATLEENIDQQSLCSDQSYISIANFNPKSTIIEKVGFERPNKLIKTNNCNPSTQQASTKLNSSSSTSQVLLSFGDSSSTPIKPHSSWLHENLDLIMTEKLKDEEVSPEDISFPLMFNSKGNWSDNENYTCQGTKRSSITMSTRTPMQAQDHIRAERKRREKLSNRFIALSAILPGLKKMNKATVLGNAITYLKELQEHVKLLEEQAKNKSEESVVFVNKCHINCDDDHDMCCRGDESSSNGKIKEKLPEIEARVAEKDVLIRIHCEQQKGCQVKILGEIERIGLIIVNSSVFPFGKYAMDITVIAQMDADFCMTVKDLVRNLRSVLLN